MQDGNDKSFTLYDAVGGVGRDDIGDDFFNEFDASQSELLDPSKEFDKKEEDAEDLSELDLSASLDKSNDSVRVYLREMGMVPLLTREGEIELAKRIERGQNAVRKALSRSSLVVRKLIEIRPEVERGNILVLDILQAPDLTATAEEEVHVEPLREQLVLTLHEIERLFRKAQTAKHKLNGIVRSSKPKQFRKCRFEYARLLVQISWLIREMAFTASFQRRLSGILRGAVDELRPLERDIARVQRKLEASTANESSASSAIR